MACVESLLARYTDAGTRLASDMGCRLRKRSPNQLCALYWGCNSPSLDDAPLGRTVYLDDAQVGRTQDLDATQIWSQHDFLHAIGHLS